MSYKIGYILEIWRKHGILSVTIMKKIILTLLVAVSIVSCHVFLNPADPDSDNFSGEVDRVNYGISEIEYSGPDLLGWNTESAFQILGTETGGGSIDVTADAVVVFMPASTGSASVVNGTSLRGDSLGNVIANVSYTDDEDNIFTCAFTVDVVDLYQNITVTCQPTVGLEVEAPFTVAALTYDGTVEDVTTAIGAGEVSFNAGSAEIHVDGSGLPSFYALTTDSVDATVTFTDTNGTAYSDDVQFNVSAIASGITFGYAYPALGLNEETDFSLTLNLNDGTTQDITNDTSVTVTMDTGSAGQLEVTNVAGVNYLTGTAKGTANGSIYYTNAESLTFADTFSIEVDAHCSGVTMTVPTEVAIGEDEQYTVTASYSDGTSSDITAEIGTAGLAISGAGQVSAVIIGTEGYFTGVEPGTVSVTASYTDAFGDTTNSTAYTFSVLNLYQGLVLEQDWTGDMIADDTHTFHIEGVLQDDTREVIAGTYDAYSVTPAGYATITYDDLSGVFSIIPTIQTDLTFSCSYTDSHGTNYTLSETLTVAQTIVYVDAAAADDTGDGTVFDPVQTIPAAITRAAALGAADPVIRIAEGTYTTTTYFEFDIEGLTVQGGYDPGAIPWTRDADPATNATVLQSTALTWYTGIDPVNAARTILVSNMTDGPTFSDLTVFGPDNSNSRTAGILIEASTGVVINENCRIYGGTGVDMATGVLVNGTSGTADPDIAFSQIYGNTDTPFNGSMGIALFGDAPAVIRQNNPVSGGIGTATTGIYVEVDSPADSPEIYDNQSIYGGEGDSATGIHIAQTGQNITLTGNDILMYDAASQNTGIIIDSTNEVTVTGGSILIQGSASADTGGVRYGIDANNASPLLRIDGALIIDLSAAGFTPITACGIYSAGTPLDLSDVSINSGTGSMVSQGINISEANYTIAGGSIITGDSQFDCTGIRQDFAAYDASNSGSISETFIQAGTATAGGSSNGVYSLRTDTVINPGTTIIVSTGSADNAFGLYCQEGNVSVLGDVSLPTQITVTGNNNVYGLWLINGTGFEANVTMTSITILDGDINLVGIDTGEADLNMYGSTVSVGNSSTGTSYGVYSASGDCTIAAYNSNHSVISAGDGDGGSAGIYNGTGVQSIEDTLISSGTSSNGPSYGIYSAGGPVQISVSDISTGDGVSVAGIYAEAGVTDISVSGDSITEPCNIQVGQAAGSAAGDDAYGIYAPSAALDLDFTNISGVSSLNLGVAYGVYSGGTTGQIDISNTSITMGSSASELYGLYIDSPPAVLPPVFNASTVDIADFSCDHPTGIYVTNGDITVSGNSIVRIRDAGALTLTTGIRVIDGDLDFIESSIELGSGGLIRGIWINDEELPTETNILTMTDSSISRIDVADTAATAMFGIHAPTVQMAIDGSSIYAGDGYSVNAINAGGTFCTITQSDINAGDSTTGSYGMRMAGFMSPNINIQGTSVSSGDSLGGPSYGIFGVDVSLSVGDFVSAETPVPVPSVITVGSGINESSGIHLDNAGTGNLVFEDSMINVTGAANSLNTYGIYSLSTFIVNIDRSRIFAGAAQIDSAGAFIELLASSANIYNSIISGGNGSARSCGLLLSGIEDHSFYIAHNHLDAGASTSVKAGIYIDGIFSQGRVFNNIIHSSATALTSYGILEAADNADTNEITFNNIDGFAFPFYDGPGAGWKLIDEGMTGTSDFGDNSEVTLSFFPDYTIDSALLPLVLADIERIAFWELQPARPDIDGTYRGASPFAIGPYEYVIE